MSSKRNLQTPEVCPICNEDVPRGALACPNCGADHKSGWNDSFSNSADLGLPDENFDYDEFVKNEFGDDNEIRPQGLKRIWWITAIVLLLISFLGFVMMFMAGRY
jgi:hypothetical protein